VYFAIGVIYLIYVIISHLTYPKRADKQTREYREKQDKELGLEPWEVRYKKFQ
jgi:hypothetical protein